MIQYNLYMIGIDIAIHLRRMAFAKH
jgi:hypothetical protein